MKKLLLLLSLIPGICFMPAAMADEAIDIQSGSEKIRLNKMVAHFQAKAADNGFLKAQEKLATSDSNRWGTTNTFRKTLLNRAATIPLSTINQ